MYSNGQGVPENEVKAAQWRIRAAKLGDVVSQSLLGGRYSLGNGVPQDDFKAVYWYTKAATQGNIAAQFFLGDKYFTGEGVPKDYVRAYAWLSIAAAQEDFLAPMLKSTAINCMTPAQIAEAQKLSREYWEKYVVPFQKE